MRIKNKKGLDEGAARQERKSRLNSGEAPVLTLLQGTGTGLLRPSFLDGLLK
jgi:hypothetical protein